MSLTALTLLLGMGQPAPADPMNLPIGTPGKATLGLGYHDLRTNKVTDLDQIVKAVENHRFVFFGESHDKLAHHQGQAAVIDALARSGRSVVVGFEMFTRPNQKNLARWTLGKETEEEFIANSDWKTQWGFDFALYRPIFDVVRQNRLPMVALNVPRDWVRTVGKSGFAGLSPEAKAQLPEMFLGNTYHRSIFTAMMGGHEMPNMDNTYAAMVLWDEGMADSALKYMQWRSGKKPIMVIVAGLGHGLYKQGINYRINRRTGEDVFTIISVEREKDGPTVVSRGIGDVAFAPETAGATNK